MAGNRLGDTEWSRNPRFETQSSQLDEVQVASALKPETQASQETPPQNKSIKPKNDHGSGFRIVVEWLSFLALAVIIFRTFIAEGYMISTGSMAPTLLGFHRRIDCPSCNFTFVIGDSPRTNSSHAEHQDRNTTDQYVICPNCRETDIAFSDVPRNEGDQLLVLKNAYDWQLPKRWDVIVFRNPNNSSQAYVKRVVGLPGEKIEIKNGDIYVDGLVERKSLRKQRAIRIPVCDHSHSPSLQDNPDWLQRWMPTEKEVTWESNEATFVFNNINSDPTSGPSNDGSDIGWLLYRHGRQTGVAGKFTTSLESWPENIHPPEQYDVDLQFDEEKKQLTINGVMKHKVADRLISDSKEPEFFNAIRRLYQKSHRIPVDDFYGYNHPFYGLQKTVPVRDLMLSFNLTARTPQKIGTLFASMTNGDHRYTVEFDLAEQKASLYRDKEPTPLRTGTFSKMQPGVEAQVEMSLFDQQVLLVINDQEVFTPWAMEVDHKKTVEIIAESTKSFVETSSNGLNKIVKQKTDELKVKQARLRQPIRIGARGTHVKVSDLKVYRDVYYRTEELVNNELSQQLGEEELFVLGDNSPISIDSRAWPEGTIKVPLLIGKPFLLHLPSRPGNISIAGYEWRIRIPDFSRIRFIE